MRELLALEAEPERRVIGKRDQREVEQHLVPAVLVGDLGDERLWRTLAARQSAACASTCPSTMPMPASRMM